MATFAELTKSKGMKAELFWARNDTRWHVYPSEQPQQ